CEAGEDNNNSCNNISIGRQGDGNQGNTVQVSKQNSKCEAGEDNNNSCNNISIGRQGDGNQGNNHDYGDDHTDKQGNTVQVSKQNSKCEAGEDNNNSCINSSIQNILESKLKLISHTRP
ncbi:MAG: hypothetical protein AB7P13_07195, partial [Candidatus Nitrosocosmicus sp.]